MIKRIAVYLLLLLGVAYIARADFAALCDVLALETINTCAYIGFCSNGTICGHCGVTCSGSPPHIVGLNVNTTGLSSLPATLGNMTYLITLVVSSNTLTALPTSILHLTALTTLNVDNNHLTALPAGINALTALVTLEAHTNLLTALPTLTGLTKMASMSIYSNHLSALPSTFGTGLTSLVTLIAYSNQITALPATFGSLIKLATLRINNNNLTTFPTAISTLTALASLDAYVNKLTTLPDEIGSLAALTYLDISNNVLPELPSTFGHLALLKYLDVDTNSLTALPADFGHLHALTSLYADENLLTAIPTTVCNLTALLNLDFSDNQLSAVPSCIGQLTHLVFLDIDINSIAALPETMLRMDALADFYMNSNNFVTLPDWLGYITSITALDIACNYIKTIPATFSGLTAIISLSLDGNFLTCTDVPAGIFTTTCKQTCQYSTAPARPPDVSTLLPVDLGTAVNYTILAKSGISTVPTSAIVGNIAVSPISAAAITGFSLVADVTFTFATSTQVSGNVYAANYMSPTPSQLTTAVLDMQAAFVDAAGRSADVTELGAGNIGGMTLAPGVYSWSTGLLIPADVTLAGSTADVWIFQVAQTLTVSSGAKIVLAGGALPSNIFWQVSGSVAIGTTAQFNGVILCHTNIALQNGASVQGRLYAQTAVTLDGNTVNATDPAIVANYTGAYYTGAFVCNATFEGGVTCESRSCLNHELDCSASDLCILGTCDSILGCVQAPATCIDDDDACTVDSCNPTTGECTHDVLNCSDADACTLDTCNVTTGCVHTRTCLSPGAIAGIVLGSTFGGLLLIIGIGFIIGALVMSGRGGGSVGTVHHGKKHY